MYYFKEPLFTGDYVLSVKINLHKNTLFIQIKKRKTKLLFDRPNYYLQVTIVLKCLLTIYLLKLSIKH